MTEQEILNKAVVTYGEENQIDMAIEECSELIQALCKYKRTLKNPYTKEQLDSCMNNIYGEIADVKIMMKQLNIIFNSEEIQFAEIFKMTRLKQRLNEKDSN